MSQKKSRSWQPMLLLVLLMVIARDARAEEQIDFARQILPILSDKCFICHGPDARDPDLVRLDSFEAATMDLGGYRAIDPDDPGASEIIERVNSDDAPMPPEDADKQLNDEEKRLITAWAKQGGKYTKHWAFVPPTKDPAVAGQTTKHAIDFLIQRQLQRNKVDFADEADRATLARRAALILTGLPPAPEQLDRFLNDDRKDAYEHYVDELLASPRYGEHQARYWLDAVRYGDTHGLHLDNRRGIYPYRDWVIYALNNNLPFDEFIRWQVAGDMLPDPTMEQLVATGYVRMNPSTSEGGVIPAEFQAKNNFDRTENLGTVFLGMSLVCARCHTHKYDPITQHEYYELLAFFNNTAEPALDGNSYTYGPTVRTPGDLSDWYVWSSLQDQLTNVMQQADVMIADDQFRAKAMEYAQDAIKFETSDWMISAAHESGIGQPGVYKPVSGLPGKIAKKLPKSEQTIWIVFDVDSAVKQEIDVVVAGGPGSLIHTGRSEVEFSKSGKAPLVLNGTDKAEVLLQIRGLDSQPEVRVETSSRWQSLAATKDWNKLSVRDRLSLMADEYGPFGRHDIGIKARSLANQIQDLESRFTTTLVARELPNPRETRLLDRGEYDQPTGDRILPNVFDVMGRLPDNTEHSRLDLANWLTASDHPLVSRVLVNRIWQRTFGDALVRSPEDFGLQGQQPTHPELLDFLAVDFIENGWDLKRLLKQMVLSRTFMQDSAVRRDIDDPENKLFARGPRFRLDAEVLRDMGLWASGLLKPEMGGEGVKPYQPDGMWKALAHPASNTKLYVRDKDERIYRRSIYVYWKRTSPHPMMTLFDAPSRESSCVRRSRTSTSLQSLGLFNETQRVEMARVLAARLIKSNPDNNRRMDMLFRLVASRKPSEIEHIVCTDLLKRMTKRFHSTPDDAIGLLSIGDYPRDESLDPTAHAAWTQVVIAVLASDVAIMVN